jgi:hypothetical protein
MPRIDRDFIGRSLKTNLILSAAGATPPQGKYGAGIIIRGFRADKPVHAHTSDAGAPISRAATSALRRRTSG